MKTSRNPTTSVPETELSGIEIVTSPERFRALKPQWDALWCTCGKSGVFQSFDCCLQVWQTMAEPARRKLFCLVGWERGQMVAVWPLTTYRKLAWKLVRPLDASGAEFTDVLIAETVDRQNWIQAAWQVLRTQSKSDVITFPYVRAGTNLSVFLSGGPKTTLDRNIAVYAHLRGEKDWQTYYESLNGKHRRHHAQSRRRLAELGAVEFEIVEAGDPRCPELIEWLLSQKRIWAERTNKKGQWLFSDRYCKFLKRFLADSQASPKRLIMSLTLNAAPIAVKITAVGEEILEGLIAGFDPQYERYSPGMRLDEYMVKWALEHKLDYDFGNGGEHYKRFWSRDNVVETATYRLALSWWGRAALYLSSKRAGQRVEGNRKPTRHQKAVIEISKSGEIATRTEHLLEQ